jgi:hypothetical protein
MNYVGKLHFWSRIASCSKVGFNNLIKYLASAGLAIPELESVGLDNPSEELVVPNMQVRPSVELFKDVLS